MKKPTVEMNVAGMGDINVAIDLELQTQQTPPDTSLAVVNFGGMAIALKPEVEKRKQDALETAAFITAVSNPNERELAIEAAGQLKGYLAGLEKSRKDVKQPFWDAGVQIDKIAKEAAKEAGAEVARLEALLTGYQKQLEAEARRQREEAERKEREAQAERDRQIAEERRLCEEAERKGREAAEAAAAAKTKTARLEAEKLALQAQLDAQAAAEAQRKREAAEFAADFAPAPEGSLLPALPGAAAGQTVRRQYEVEVTDIDALYKKYGSRFVKMTVDLAAVKASLVFMKPEEFAGLKITDVTKVAVRAAKN